MYQERYLTHVYYVDFSYISFILIYFVYLDIV